MKGFFAVFVISAVFSAVFCQEAIDCDENLTQYLHLSESVRARIDEVIISASQHQEDVVEATLAYVRGLLDTLDFQREDLGWLASLYRRGAKAYGPAYVNCIVDYVLNSQ